MLDEVAVCLRRKDQLRDPCDKQWVQHARQDSVNNEQKEY